LQGEKKEIREQADKYGTVAKKREIALWKYLTLI
jgi:hypothetical protein